MSNPDAFLPEDDAQPIKTQLSLKVNNGERVICGFWRRIFASTIDGCLLGIIGIVLGLVLGDWFASLGGYGRLLGLPIMVLYFGILNSHLGQGQTLGKKLMRIKVVDSQNQFLSLGKSVIRALILEVPSILNGMLLPAAILMSPVAILIGLLVFGLGGSIIYLYIFNGKTRQSVHDLAVGSYVVKVDTLSVIPETAMSKVHYIFPALLVILVMGFYLFVGQQLSKNQLMKELSSTQENLSALPKVYQASLFAGTNYTPSESISSLSTDLYYAGSSKDAESLETQAASLMLLSYPNARKQDLLVVSVRTGYDIGIASFWMTHHEALSPQEWEARIKSQKKTN